MQLQFKEQQFQKDAVDALVQGFVWLRNSADFGINKILKTSINIKKELKYLFVNKINGNFTLLNTTYSYSTYKSTLIKDNTPSRLAAMQHTWEVFSFYTLPQYQNYYANL